MFMCITDKINVMPSLPIDKPTPPQPPIEIVEGSLSAIEFKWRTPKDDGGCPITNYLVERQQLGRNTWTKIGEIPGQASYRDTDVDGGRKYTYRVRAKNSEGTSDTMETDDIAAGSLCRFRTFCFHIQIVPKNIIYYMKHSLDNLTK